MSRLVVATIVEGHGEVAAVRVLLRRIWSELLGGHSPDTLDLIKPFRTKRFKIVKPGELARVMEYAASKLKLQCQEGDRALVLILLDAEEDAACQLGPELLAWAREAVAHVDVTCVLANREYETWFVAAAESLGKYLDLSRAAIPDDPEAAGAGKGWIRRVFRGPSYSETQDQPRMSSAMDLDLCRRRSPSFDKLCRELHRRMGGGSS